MDALAGLVLTALGLLVLYFVVRSAVHHGILDADRSRRETTKVEPTALNNPDESSSP